MVWFLCAHHFSFTPFLLSLAVYFDSLENMRVGVMISVHPVVKLFGKDFNVGFSSEARSSKLCMIIVSVMLYNFIPVLVTVT